MNGKRTIYKVLAQSQIFLTFCIFCSTVKDRKEGVLDQQGAATGPSGENQEHGLILDI